MNKIKILFIIDELEFKWFEFNTLVTNFWIIKELLCRDIDVYVTTKSQLFVKNAKGHAICYPSKLENDGNISFSKKENYMLIEDFNTVFFRPDPPLDVDYINACNIFEFVDMKKVQVVNNPLSIKAFNEKMHVNLFPQFVPENIVTNNKKLIIEFVNKHEKAVIKPLNRCFGSGVYILKKNDENISSILSTATENEKTMVMIQKYLNGAKNGDKRVLLINGEVLDECVRKLPAENDFKFAQHNDKYFAKDTLTENEKFIANTIAKKLNEMGLPLVGLDMIDEKIIEINVTSPCYFIKEINALNSTKFEDKLMKNILKLCKLEQKEKTYKK